ncbi:MAG: HAMP domain-containing histidine kinase [Thermoleophilaceae bacterium]|nr:HAMP domain-containing histidine kinase [Thermoleophilaceae bacterium]
MKLPRATVRLRLALLYTALFLVAGGLLLGISYTLLDGHLHRTLTAPVADDVLADVRGQYALALVAVSALALLAGWLAAGRLLGPLREIVTAARSVGGDSLDRRIAAHGPHDELRELAETFDEMLDRLQAAFTSQRRFVANASHELRTPLTVMRTEIEVALGDPGASAEELRRAADVVRDEVIRCQGLIDGLLALARTEAGAVERDEEVDLAELMRAAAGELAGPAGERGLSIELRVDFAPVLGDRRLLERLAWNLAENAVLHNRVGGYAEIEVAAAGRDVVVRVENSGPRVPPEAAGGLLEPFERLGSGRGGGPGAGVGLSIVRAVASAHGGTVDLTARREGGLRVVVRLPGLRDGRGAASSGARARDSRRLASVPRHGTRRGPTQGPARR